MKPWQKKMWCIPPKQSAEFVCAMENVLEVYQRPYDPKHPVVCMDETSKQLVQETRDIVKCCGSGFDQAASLFSPSTNWTPRITSASSFEPLRARQCCSAH